MENSYAKLIWATNHLNTLHAAIAEFSANPYGITREDDLENGSHILRLKLLDVPTHICLIAGDAVYNMRASLDQLVWSLANLSGIPKRTAFPIVDGPVLTRDKLRSSKRSLLGVPKEAVCEIEFLQPYHRGASYKTHPLWRLDEMCNLDKHRRIPANGSATVLRFPNVTREEFATRVVAVDTTDDGFIVSTSLALKHKLDDYYPDAFAVMFGGDESGISEQIRGLAQICKFISESVFPRFTRFFT
jgi:hypothetical protein